MSQCLAPPHSPFALLALVQDRLGWDLFLEGCISTLFLKVTEAPHSRCSRRPVTSWGQDFVVALLRVTHAQWLCHSSKVHLQVDGLTKAEHSTLFREVADLMWTDPDALLPRHRHLFDVDFETLGSGPALARQVWVASVRSALAAAESVRLHRVVPGSLPRFLAPGTRSLLRARDRAPPSQPVGWSMSAAPSRGAAGSGQCRGGAWVDLAARRRAAPGVWLVDGEFGTRESRSGALRCGRGRER